jgi:dTDP-glucose pyrophosphorylase
MNLINTNFNMVDWKKALISSNASLRQVIDCMNTSSLRIALIVNNEHQLEGTICDGDIRRALLKGLTLESPIDDVIHRGALVVPPTMNPDMVFQIMIANHIQQVPVVDENQRVIDLYVWDQIFAPPPRRSPLVIMAGGKGVRLRPFTENCPKPLVKVAGKPMLEHIINRAKLEGFKEFVLSIHHLGYMIEDYFGDGKKFDVSINYLKEDAPLGTAGALSLLTDIDQPFLVTNGDVLTDIRYGDLLDFHNRHSAVATMAVRRHEWQHPFGVVQTQGIDIVGFEEKPISLSYINAGVYALSPEVLSLLKRDSVCDMPTLFERLQAQGLKTIAYPMHEPWMDVGRPDDLEIAHRAVSDPVGFK